eukprot:9414379-Alexandrium_andersonii.AAC.1
MFGHSLGSARGSRAPALSGCRGADVQRHAQSHQHRPGEDPVAREGLARARARRGRWWLAAIRGSRLGRGGRL